MQNGDERISEDYDCKYNGFFTAMARTMRRAGEGDFKCY